MPRSGDDGSNYDIIARVKDWVATPGEAELKQMTAFYQELTALRKSSPLFTLGDGATVMQRVDFRNTGADQQTGLLVMTIDDGIRAGASPTPASTASWWRSTLPRKAGRCRISPAHRSS